MEIKKINIMKNRFKNKYKVLALFSFVIIFTIQAQKHDIPRPGFVVSTATIQYGIPTSKLISPTWYLTLRGEGFIEKNLCHI